MCVYIVRAEHDGGGGVAVEPQREIEGFSELAHRYIYVYMYMCVYMVRAEHDGVGGVAVKPDERRRICYGAGEYISGLTR